MLAFDYADMMSAFNEFEAVRPFLDAQWPQGGDDGVPEDVVPPSSGTLPVTRGCSKFALAARLASAARLNRPKPVVERSRAGGRRKAAPPSTRSGWLLARLPPHRGPACHNVIAFPLPAETFPDLEKAA